MFLTIGSLSYAMEKDEQVPRLFTKITVDLRNSKTASDPSFRVQIAEEELDNDKNFKSNLEDFGTVSEEPHSECSFDKICEKHKREVNRVDFVQDLYVHYPYKDYIRLYVDNHNVLPYCCKITDALIRFIYHREEIGYLRKMSLNDFTFIRKNIDDGFMNHEDWEKAKKDYREMVLGRYIIPFMQMHYPKLFDGITVENFEENSPAKTLYQKDETMTTYVERLRNVFNLDWKTTPNSPCYFYNTLTSFYPEEQHLTDFYKYPWNYPQSIQDLFAQAERINIENIIEGNLGRRYSGNFDPPEQQSQRSIQIAPTPKPETKTEAKPQPTRIQNAFNKAGEKVDLAVKKVVKVAAKVENAGSKINEKAKNLINKFRK